MIGHDLPRQGVVLDSLQHLAGDEESPAPRRPPRGRAQARPAPRSANPRRGRRRRRQALPEAPSAPSDTALLRVCACRDRAAQHAAARSARTRRHAARRPRSPLASSSPSQYAAIRADASSQFIASPPAADSPTVCKSGESASNARARASLDMTVPIGMSATRAISLYESSSSSRRIRTSRKPSGSAAMASASAALRRARSRAARAQSRRRGERFERPLVDDGHFAGRLRRSQSKQALRTIARNQSARCRPGSRRNSAAPARTPPAPRPPRPARCASASGRSCTRHRDAAARPRRNACCWGIPAREEFLPDARYLRRLDFIPAGISGGRLRCHDTDDACETRTAPQLTSRRRSSHDRQCSSPPPGACCPRLAFLCRPCCAKGVRRQLQGQHRLRHRSASKAVVATVPVVAGPTAWASAPNGRRVFVTGDASSAA